MQVPIKQVYPMEYEKLEKERKKTYSLQTGNVCPNIIDDISVSFKRHDRKNQCVKKELSWLIQDLKDCR